MNKMHTRSGDGMPGLPDAWNERGPFSLDWALSLMVLCWGLAFALACRLATVAPPEEHDCVIASIIGSSRLAFSDRFMMTADRWFHKGVGRFERVGFTNWFTRMDSHIRPHHHVHLEDEGIKEIMPWLYFSVKTNPSNVAAYSVAAFFLAGQCGRADLAEKMLKEAQRVNPGDYRLFYERGRLAMKMGKLEDAARFFDAAIRLWPGGRDVADEDVLMERYSMLAYRGLLHEMLGNVGQAIALYEEALAASPSRRGLRERLEELRTAGQAASSPFDVWRMMRLQHPLVCRQDEHE